MYCIVAGGGILISYILHSRADTAGATSFLSHHQPIQAAAGGSCALTGPPQCSIRQPFDVRHLVKGRARSVMTREPNPIFNCGSHLHICDLCRRWVYYRMRKHGGVGVGGEV